MTEREKIAQIIAEHLCPQGRAHKTLYGAERMCYSRNNFADCEKVSECVDALIEAGFGDVSWWERKCKLCEEDWFLQKKQIEHYAESYKEMLQDDLDKYKHRAEVAEKERDEWKERAEKAEKEVSALNEKAKRFKIVVPMGTTVNSFGSELYRTQPNPYGVKQLYSDEEVEQIVKERDSKEEAYNKCYFDYRYWKDKAKEYKHRAEIAERKYMIALNKYAKCDRKLTHYNKMTTTYDKEITKQAEREIEEEKK